MAATATAIPSRPPTGDLPPRLDGIPATQTASATSRWECACGLAYRVLGRGRHRIYWPESAPPGEPVIDGCCLRCGRTLPGKQRHCPQRQLSDA